MPKVNLKSSSICFIPFNSSLLLLAFSPPLPQAIKKLRQFFFQKITTAEFFCDESQFSWIATENIIPMQMSTYEITSKQVLWLAPYRLIRPHFHILPSQFPNDYLSITDTKTFGAYTDSYRRGFSPHSLSSDYALRMSICSITNTLCECIKFTLLFYQISE